MSYLDLYRQNPAWATNQWQSIAPPMPSFQPQPSWGGFDYFKSAIGSLNVDPGLYNYGYASIANTSNLMSMAGTSMVEAKMQHRRAYGGLGDILVMLPQEIGAAAAYEVWRNWRYHNGILAQPLAGDVLRQREAIIGLAIGESVKLWQYTRRLGDVAGQNAAVETAAIAAARIFDQANDALVRAGGAYGTLGASSISGAALSPVLGAVGGAGVGLGVGGSQLGVGGAGAVPVPVPVPVASTAAAAPAMASTYGAADPVTASLAAAPMARARAASIGSLSSAPYGAAAPMPMLTSGAGYAGSGAGMYGGANGLLGAGSTMGSGLGVGGGNGLLGAGVGAGMGMGMGAGMGMGTGMGVNGANGMLGAGSGMGMGMNGYGGGGGMLGGSRPVSPVYPPSRPVSAYGGAGAGAFGNGPVGGGGTGPIGRRLAEHEMHKRERFAERAELSAQRAGYEPGYGGGGYGGGGYGGGGYGGSGYGGGGGYGGGEYGGGGGSYGRAYDDLDGYGYGRRRRPFRHGGRSGAGGYY